MKTYKIHSYQSCIFHKQVPAESPEKALALFKAGFLRAPTLEDAVHSIEIDPDSPPAQTAVWDTEQEVTVLVEGR